MGPVQPPGNEHARPDGDDRQVENGAAQRLGPELTAKPGGRIWTGDVHALQGDGVVDQTAIETAAEDLQIRYDLHRQVGLRGPLGETEQAWIVGAFAASLDDALVACLREVIYWLPAAAGITGPEAYALASMAASFRVTQYERPKAVNVATLPFPGFPTDLQPMAIGLASIADGTSMITENVFEARFRFVEEMIRLGADARHGGRVLLADLALRADQAMIHDAGELGPGIQELVDAHRLGHPDLVRPPER